MSTFIKRRVFQKIGYYSEKYIICLGYKGYNPEYINLLLRNFKNNDLLVTANYPEKFGVKENKDAGFQTTDIFLLKKGKGVF